MPPRNVAKLLICQQHVRRHTFALGLPIPPRTQAIKHDFLWIRQHRSYPRIGRLYRRLSTLDPVPCGLLSIVNNQQELRHSPTHDEVLAEHQRVIDGGGYGVPTLVFPDGQMLFGPVLLDPPTGEAAVRLWHSVTAWLEFPHVFELQRPKTPAHQRAIATAFRPYLDARDWVSINRGEGINLSRPNPQR